MAAEKINKKPGFMKELISFIFVSSIIMSIGGGAIFYLYQNDVFSGQNHATPSMKTGKKDSQTKGDAASAPRQGIQGSDTGAQPQQVPQPAIEQQPDQPMEQPATPEEGYVPTNQYPENAVPVSTMEPAPQLANGAAEQPAPLPSEVGGLKGTITWQYNNFVGTKPDVEAKIYLIPVHFNRDSITDDQAKRFAMIGSIPKDSGLFFTKANGYGNYELQNIPVGDYYTIIISNKTNRNLNEPVNDYVLNYIKPLIRDWESFQLFNFRVNKYEVKQITIQQNQVLDVSRDFGFTYF